MRFQHMLLGSLFLINLAGASPAFAVTVSDIVNNTHTYRDYLDHYQGIRRNEIARQLTEELARTHNTDVSDLRLRAFVGTLVRFDLIERSALSQKSAESYLARFILEVPTPFKRSLMVGWLIRYAQAKINDRTPAWAPSFERRINTLNSEWKDAIKRTSIFIHGFPEFSRELHEPIERFDQLSLLSEESLPASRASGILKSCKAVFLGLRAN